MGRDEQESPGEERASRGQEKRCLLQISCDTSCKSEVIPPKPVKAQGYQKGWKAKRGSHTAVGGFSET